MLFSERAFLPIDCRHEPRIGKILRLFYTAKDRTDTRILTVEGDPNTMDWRWHDLRIVRVELFH